MESLRRKRDFACGKNSKKVRENLPGAIHAKKIRGKRSRESNLAAIHSGRSRSELKKEN